MVSAIVLRTECLGLGPGPRRIPLLQGALSSWPISQSYRCTTSSGNNNGKGPPDDNKDKKKAEDSNPLTWGNLHLRPPRRNRFGPKSQKIFQTATDPLRHYGTRNFDLKLVKDAWNVPILIPGRLLKDDEETSSNNSGEPLRRRRRRRKLPLVNAAALLDKNSYCKKSAFPGGTATRSRGEAAKRLLKGKKDLVQMLRGHVVWQQSQRPFCLTGHGIPPQLLQDHLNMADAFLQNFGEPAECALMSRMDDDGGDMSYPESMRIMTQDGASRIWTWPPQRLFEKSQLEDSDELQDISQQWDHSLVLYLAAMDRIAKELGPVGSHFSKEDCISSWTVKMYRGMAYPIEMISRPDDEEDGRPVPILEWSPLSSGNRMSTSVSIRLQGTPTRTTVVDEDGAPDPDPVTLEYDAIFPQDPRVEPILA